MIEGFRIVDAHCHPIAAPGESLVNAYGTPDNTADFFAEMRTAGVDFCCGSVIKSNPDPKDFSGFARANAEAFRLWKEYPDFYQPGIRINPRFVRESIAEVEKYHRLGVSWVGELVPYSSGYDSYSSPEILEIFAVVRDFGMTLSIHPTDNADIIRLMENMPGLQVVAAHPGERPNVLERAEMMKRFPGLHWDICGTGLFRWGMLKYLVDQCGTEKLLFGTDFPICNIAMQIYGVLGEHISDEARKAIFSGNFDRLSGR